ncbi:MAG: hypothetical protein JW929_10750 [Anaerolineales bacterium]|nr:hypothetical protein [Anaerolineales bacterium]
MRVFRRGRLAGIGAVLAVILAACGQSAGDGGAVTPMESPTQWQLPPAFTPTLSATATLEPQAEPSATLTAPPAPAMTFRPLAAGWNHTCAVTAEGGVMCWGRNDNGQLGDGSRTNRNRPVGVKGPTVLAVAVTAGWGHTCVLTEDGGVLCWGRNKYGQLGDGTNQRSSEPVAVSGLDSGVVAIAAGDDHTCALTASGGVQCWGLNESGQLGDGTTESRNTPVDVPALKDGAAFIAAGTAHTCAGTLRGEVMCWGNNELGQLGDRSERTAWYAPAPVVNLSGGVAALAAKGGHACVLTEAGGILCWGQNAYGQLGDGTKQNQSAPVNVAGFDGAAAGLAAGWSQTCAFSADGVLRCWGWNFYGQLGDDSVVSRLQPVEVKGITGKVAAVDGGGGHTCALTDDGAVHCWGFNESGQLGDKTNQDRLLPAIVSGITAEVKS